MLFLLVLQFHGKSRSCYNYLNLKFYCKVFYLGEMSFKLYIQQFNICDIFNGAINYKLRNWKIANSNQSESTNLETI